MSDQHVNPEGAPSAPPAGPTVEGLRAALKGSALDPTGVSLADLMAWDALSDEVRDLASRILLGGALHADASLRAAYEGGFADGVDAYEEEVMHSTRTPIVAPSDFTDWLARQSKKKK